MGISLELAIGVVVLTLLGLLLTGPGMWSEKWGWKFLRGRRREDEPREPSASPTARGSRR
jgi:hypothetical protein